MSFYNDIDKHMVNKFDSFDKIEVLNTLPTQNKLEDINDNQVYKVRYTCIFIDVVDFKKIDEYTDSRIVNSIMSEYVYGVTKIMKEFSGQGIDVQGDGVFCIVSTDTKAQIDNAYNLAIYLNTFVQHLNKRIHNTFGRNFRNHPYNMHADFKCGIGVWFSFDNYISKVGHNKSRELIYMGESVRNASVLSKLANRGSMYDPILMNNLFVINLEDQRGVGNSRNTFIANKPEVIYGTSFIRLKYYDFVNRL